MIITLKDGSTKEYSEPKSIIEIAADISEGLARMACAGEVNGEVEDLRTGIDKDCNLSILTFNDEGGKAAFRHTTSHIMAQAIKRLYPETKLAIGPSIADGFYYDVDRDTPLTSEDLEKIEAEMKKIVKEDLKLERFELPRAEAIAFMKEKEEPYKVELIEDLPEDAVISFYRQGEFTDLCAGPHLMSTKPVKAFKLTSLAGAYWRGSEKNKMLQRIYGTAFTKKAELEEYLHMIEEAKKPYIFVGGGCVISGASKEISELAHKIQAPVCDTLMGKGTFPGEDPLYTGMVGMHGTKTSDLGVTECDLLIVLGARFSDRVTGNTKTFAHNAKILQIDVDAAEINKNIKVDASVIGDVKEELKRLLEEVPEKEHPEWITHSLQVRIL